jgi:isopentenyldiphosphate isomerase
MLFISANRLYNHIVENYLSLRTAESVCAHVRYGEDYVQAAKRRLREELGLAEDIELSEVTKFPLNLW